jgi:hypothetical protein
MEAWKERAFDVAALVSFLVMAVWTVAAFVQSLMEKNE